MVTIQEIEKAVSNLPPEEMAKFRVWFEEFDAQLWDRQLEQDVKAGKLDNIANKALTDFKEGKFTEL
ncbi:MAG: hypothetical protein H8D96_00305 [Desulfobacterales bacterium]|uniref:Uncharacterized protein n=1 Tax=Candidatus Desulfatibia vada TaxID=2841696 RepID=A0A8J6NXK7_9BACT|nr:hypothetical protein [Candidatus Desulfatibia vada]